MFQEGHQQWKIMSLYERFEQIIVLVLTFIIGLVIVISLFQLLAEVWNLLFLQGENPLNHATFQTFFGMILTVMIAMEFKHSLIKAIDRKNHIIHVRTVILIALLALARKLIVLDTSTTAWETVAVIAFSVLALGATYWLLKIRDQRVVPAQPPKQRHDNLVKQ